MPTDQLASGSAEDPMVMFSFTDQVRETLQHSPYVLLAERGPAVPLGGGPIR